MTGKGIRSGAQDWLGNVKRRQKERLGKIGLLREEVRVVKESWSDKRERGCKVRHFGSVGSCASRCHFYWREFSQRRSEVVSADELMFIGRRQHESSL